MEQTEPQAQQKDPTEPGRRWLDKMLEIYADVSSKEAVEHNRGRDNSALPGYKRRLANLKVRNHR